MRKPLAILLVFCTLCFSGCSLSNKGIAVEETDECTKITLDNFEGKQKIEIDHDSPNEGGLYYSTNITNGSVTVSYDEGWLWEAYELFTVSNDTNSIGGGYYIDSSTSRIIIIIEAEQKTSGEILLGFAPFE